MLSFPCSASISKCPTISHFARYYPEVERCEQHFHRISAGYSHPSGPDQHDPDSHTKTRDIGAKMLAG